jgi:hypothetical protein
VWRYCSITDGNNVSIDMDRIVAIEPRTYLKEIGYGLGTQETKAIAFITESGGSIIVQTTHDEALDAWATR